ncbi:MAG TPA: hypothetical protein VFA33_16120 [Bryobacteraceae bacterium]|nr:hypothetical protein [Bryobacteraceae bacterium]
MLVTRRKLAGALVGSAAALAQAPPPLPRTPEEELQAAREQVRQNTEALAQYPLPVAAEPACHFKA